MRVMVLVKADENSEAGVMPPPGLLEAMMNYNEELTKAGILVAGEGLKPTSQGVRIHFAGDDRTVVDGPFAETKELVAGFWIWEVESMEEAVAWAKRCPNPQLTDSDLEIRPFYTMADFAELSTPEIDEQARRVGAAAEAKHGKFM
ncbi:dehydrogenase [Acuticoccus sediminis]|uniref:Dehydrogenase n=1 Tax=Acuticoccus sediminis TaxID=2184697 RepID=A0A8B2NYH2_9HYPH|nr:YciI family protein [Acuticoccus sediminis]RAI01650.1 dehydrogenase [Acuticoccus sediminis]